ncbi:MAG: FAD binding domain-containing protein, partial [Nitratireductor sp.]
MKAPAFDYLRPASIAEAVAALAEGAGGARILAGGQSLVPMLNLRVAFAETLIDIGAIADLRAVVDEGETVLIGAGVTHATLEDGTMGDHWHGMPAFVARDIAYRAVRNRGTLGGSLCHADPAADWPVAMMALGATMLLAGPDGERALAAKDFSVDVFTTALEENEMLTGIRLPKLSPLARWSYRKM